MEYNGSLWIHWVATHKEQMEAILRSSEFCQSVVDRLYSPSTSLAICTNVVQLLVSLADVGDSVSEAFWQRCSEDIRSIDIQAYNSIEKTQMDIYHTPEGVLYNSNVIEA